MRDCTRKNKQSSVYEFDEVILNWNRVVILPYHRWDYGKGNRHAAHDAADLCLKMGWPLDWVFLSEVCDLAHQDKRVPRLNPRKKGQHAREKWRKDRLR